MKLQDWALAHKASMTSLLPRAPATLPKVPGCAHLTSLLLSGQLGQGCRLLIQGAAFPPQPPCLHPVLVLQLGSSLRLPACLASAPNHCLGVTAPRQRSHS